MAAETKAANPEHHGDVMTISPERLLFPINGVCDSLGVGRTKVYELVNEHELIKVSIGRRSFVTTESLTAYVDRLSEAASAPADDQRSAASTPTTKTQIDPPLRT